MKDTKQERERWFKDLGAESWDSFPKLWQHNFSSVSPVKDLLWLHFCHLKTDTHVAVLTQRHRRFSGYWALSLDKQCHRREVLTVVCPRWHIKKQIQQSKKMTKFKIFIDYFQYIACTHKSDLEKLREFHLL